MKIKFGSLISDGRGHIGGVVFTKGRYGPYVKSKVSPVNTCTVYQLEVRGIFSTLSKQWSTLDEYKRNEWKAFAEEHPFTNPFGDQKVLSANAMFIKTVLPISIYGGTPIDRPPTDLTVTDVLVPESVSLTTPDNQFDSNFSPTPIPVDHVLIYDSTIAISKAKNPNPGDFSFAASIPAGTASPNGPQLDLKKFAFQVGQRVAVNIYALNLTNGQRAPGAQRIVIVT